MSYGAVLNRAISDKLAYQKTSLFDKVSHDQLIDPAYQFRHSGRWGCSGSGKTTNLFATAELRKKLGFKVIVLDVQEEADFMALPMPLDHPLYPILTSQRRKPHAMRVRTLIPLAYSGGKRVIQQTEIPGHWQPFLIDMMDLETTAQDWDALMGAGAGGIRGQILKTALLKRDPEWGVLDVYVEAQRQFLEGSYGYTDETEDTRGSKPIPIVKSLFPRVSLDTLLRSLVDLASTRLLAPRIWRGNPTPYLLDWTGEILDRHQVTILKLGGLPVNLSHILTNYLLQKTFLMAQKRVLPSGEEVPPIALIVPEATNFFPETIPIYYKDSLPPLRDTFLEIFRRGRRHQLVVDYDSAYFRDICSEIKAQTHYAYMYDSPKEYLNEMLTSRNPVNRETLQNSFDLLKDRGTTLYFKPGSPYGFILHNIVPSSHMCQEGLSFSELWRSSGGAFKPVEPYYQRLNEIHESIKDRVAAEFKRFEVSIEAIREFGFSELVQNFINWLDEFTGARQQATFPQPELIKAYQEKAGKRPQQVYYLLKALAKAKLLTIDKSAHPFTITINMEKLKENAKPKQEGVTGD